jgi:GT2 family glycosyltransferase
MAGGRMHRLTHPEEVDTLGITLYASLMPGDRKDTSDPYLGPTGGCCLMTRGFVEHILAVSGYFLDARYFCYCEDTDLVLRANLLGYCPVYVDKLVALHEGQASSGGKYNNFIAYHGLRNAMWMQWKLVPRELMWRHGIWLCFAHVLTIARQILSGRGRLLFAIYADAWRRRDEFVAENAAFARSSKLSLEELQNRMSSRFYRKGYAFSVWLEIRKHFDLF